MRRVAMFGLALLLVMLTAADSWAGRCRRVCGGCSDPCVTTSCGGCATPAPCAPQCEPLDHSSTAMKIVMHNENDNTQTEMELFEVKYNITLSDDMFTERSLKK